METTLNNGKTYKFSKGIFGTIQTYCFYDGKWNHISKSFKSWEEVEKWIEIMNEPVEMKPLVFNVPSDYYLDSNRYYGD